MNILFLNPPFIGRFSRASRSPAVTKGGTLYYPIWLAYAAGVAEAAGHEVRLIDAPAQSLDLKSVFAKLNGFSPAISIIDTSTPSIYSDVKVAAEIKRQFPETYSLLVGTHPSALPADTLELSPTLDGIAIGEYDYTITDLASALADGRPLSQVKGLAWRQGQKITVNPRREPIEGLDNIPFVSRTYKKHLNYRDYFFAAANYPVVQIMTGRGCPFKCFFCVYPQVFHSRSYRPRSAANVVEEFQYIRENLPNVKEIGLEDDCFTANREHVRQICRLLIEKKIKIKWYCNVRGDVDQETLNLMKKAGCRLVTVGFESGVQEILDGMHKGEKVSRYLRFALDAKKAGILVHGCLMMGNPGDNKDTLEESYQFAKKINCDSMQFYPLYVYPGTEAFSWAKEQGLLTTEKFSQWVTKEGQHNCVLNTPELAGREMLALCDEYLKRYHLRPRYLFMKLLQAIKHPSEGMRSLKSAKVFFGKLIASHFGN